MQPHTNIEVGTSLIFQIPDQKMNKIIRHFQFPFSLCNQTGEYVLLRLIQLLHCLDVQGQFLQCHYCTGVLAVVCNLFEKRAVKVFSQQFISKRLTLVNPHQTCGLMTHQSDSSGDET